MNYDIHSHGNPEFPWCVEFTYRDGDFIAPLIRVRKSVQLHSSLSECLLVAGFGEHDGLYEFNRPPSLISNLIGLCRLFEQFWPDGMKDFRGAIWPSRWRSGTYQRVPNLMRIGTEAPTDGREEYKTMLGCREDAEECVRVLAELGIDAEIEAPHFTELECDVKIDGGASVSVPWWTVRFSRPEVPCAKP